MRMPTTTSSVITTNAIYEKGLLRPMIQLPFMEASEVTLTIRASSRDVLDDLTDWESIEEAGKTADDSLTIEQVRSLTASIPGNMADEILSSRQERF